MHPPPKSPSTPRTYRERDTWLTAINASNLTPVDKVVATVIALHFNVKTGRCNPARATIAREARISERTVIRSLARIVRATPYLAIKHSAGGRKDATNNFVLLMSGPGEAERVTQLRHPYQHPTGDKIVSPVPAATGDEP